MFFAALPLTAQAAAAEGSNSIQCSSARAVHDASCANYTGFRVFREGQWNQSRRPPSQQELLAAKIELEKQAAKAQTKKGLSGQSAGRGLKAGANIQNGVASWYGPGFHGRLTANGERYDMHAMTAAHKTLPFGTRVLVKNPNNNKTVVVRINDRGPFIKGRVIDLSKSAAQALGIDGIASVTLHEVVAANP